MVTSLSTPRRQFKYVAILVCIFLFIEVLNILLNRGLNLLGNFPREVFGLRGILFSHFLHGNLTHFLSNIMTLAVFSLLMLQYGARKYFSVTLFLMVSIGILVWLFGRSAMHIGASGLIYGYLGFLLLGGLVARQIKLMVISLLVGFFYGGLVFGVLPTQTFVSWESHFFGFVCGLFAAYFWARK